MDGSGREAGWGDPDEEEEGEGDEVADEDEVAEKQPNASGSGSGSKETTARGMNPSASSFRDDQTPRKISLPLPPKPTPRSPRPARWESGKGRCPVTGRRVLGGTDGLRRVMV